MNKSTFKVTKKSKTATVIKPTPPKGNDGWLEAHGINPKTKVILYKRVSKDFKTQEGMTYETNWEVGTTLEHPNWNPKSRECGGGKFHACDRPWRADMYRSADGDKYIAIEIEKKDLYAWPNPSHPHKIAFRKGKVLYEVDSFGKKVGAK
jgi:hypothetical protein